MYTVITFGGGNEDYYQERKRVTQKFLVGMIIDHLLKITRKCIFSGYSIIILLLLRDMIGLYLLFFLFVLVFSVTHEKKETEI